jgi:gamma-glutamyltranspeptidase
MPPTTLDACVARHALSGNRADVKRAGHQPARKSLSAAAACAALLCGLATCALPAGAKTAPAKTVFDASAVATPDRYSADTAQQIFAQGGNAVDAAVAIAFTLAVTRPDAGNLGGGGFMTLQIDGKPYFLDYSAEAPQRATRDMYVDDKGNVIKDMSSIGFRAAGVPGTVEGLWEAQKRFGKLKWKQVLAPAIHYATDGFTVDASLQKRRDDAAAKFAGKTNFNAYFAGLKSGATFRQPELAQTLGRIADDGGREFYEGQTADLIAKQMYGHGMISKPDLTQYKAVWRDPLAADWNGYRIVTAPPPSSGGIALIQLLKMKADLKPQFAGLELNSAPYIQLISQMEDRVFADRTKYAADPDATQVPVGKLTDDAYLAQRAGEVKELWAQQKAAEEKAAREKEEQEKAAREKAEQEKAAQEKAEQEKAQQAAAQASAAASGVQAGAGPAGASQPGAGQAGAGQPNTAAQPGAGQSNPGQANAPQPGAGQASAGQANVTSQPGAGQASAGQANSNQPGAGTSNMGQPGANQPSTAAPSSAGQVNAVAASAPGAPQASLAQPQPVQAKPAQPAQAQPDSAAASTNSASGDTPPSEKPQTTHFSVVDKWGNAVSTTYTLNGAFGSGVVVDGGGFLLNDAMDDFVAKPGAGMDEANTIAPGRRPVSSMTPTIVLKDGKVALVIGTPGGSRIFTTIFQVMTDLYDFGMPPTNALAAMRFHHQALPPKAIYWEPFHPITGDLAQQLQKLGYTPEGQDFNGDVQMIRIDGTTPQPAADPRGAGVARVFP